MLLGHEDTFALNENGEVVVLKKLDRENISKYTLTAQIIEKGTGKILEEDEFIIQVLDINDNTPMFSETPVGFIYERARKGTKHTSIVIY